MTERAPERIGARELPPPEPELSHRLGDAAQWPPILGLAPIDRLLWSQRIAEARTFDDLAPEDRTLVEQAENNAALAASGSPAWALLAAAGDTTDGAMVALVPAEDEDARNPLALDPDVVPGALLPEDLHLTVAFLGEADGWTPEQQQAVISLLQALAEQLPPGDGHAFGAAHWNTDTDDPSWVLNVGGQGLEDVHRHVFEILHNATVPGESKVPLPPLPEQHAPWVPHVCLAYTPDPGIGPLVEGRVGRDLTFDRLRIAFGEEVTDLKLAGRVDSEEAARLDLEVFHSPGGEGHNQQSHAGGPGVRDLTGDLTDAGLSPEVAARVQTIQQQFADRYGFGFSNAEALPTDSQAIAQVFGPTLLINPKRLADAPLKKAERGGWAAPGTGSVEGAMTHELGHALLHGNYGPGAGGKGQAAMIQGKIAARRAGLSSITDVSKYASSEQGIKGKIEAEAELFAAYHWGGTKRSAGVVAWGQTYHEALGIDATPFSEVG